MINTFEHPVEVVVGGKVAVVVKVVVVDVVVVLVDVVVGIKLELLLHS